MKNLTLITPTFAPDYQRFLFQRESIERCGIDLEHLAIVNTEDVPLFQQIPFQHNLTIISTQDALGAEYDKRRLVWGISRKNYRYWVTGKGIHGWMIQQLSKLAAASIVKTDAIVCLDSDTFFVNRVTARDFYHDDGRLHLYETTQDLDVEMAEWYAHSLRFLGLGVTQVPVRRYTHSPVPFHCAVVRDMLKAIEASHELNWKEAMFRADRIMEYTTYGTYARHIDNLERVVPVEPSLMLYYWFGSDADQIAMDMSNRVFATGAKMVLVNSSIGLAPEVYRPAVEGLWEGFRTGD